MGLEKTFRIYYAASALHTKPIATQIAILLNCAGEEARDTVLFNNFSFSLNDENLTIDIVLDRHKVFCYPGNDLFLTLINFGSVNKLLGKLFDKW